MKKLYYSFGALIVLAAGAAITLTQIKARVINAFETDFTELKTTFAIAEHGNIDFDIWNRALTVRDISLRPSKVDDASATRISKLTAMGVSHSGDLVSADSVAIEGLATTFQITTLNAGVRYEAPTIKIERFSTRAFPASAGISTLAWTRQVLSGITAASIAVPTLKSVANLPQLPSAPTPSATAVVAPLEQEMTNVRFEGVHDGKVERVTLEHAKASSQMPPPVKGEFSTETRGSFITDFDLAASLSLLDADAQNPVRGFTTLWRTAGSGPITINGEKAVKVSIAGVVSDGMSIDIAKFRSSLTAVQATNTKASPRATPAQAQAMLTAMSNLYESFNLGLFEYKDMAIEIPGVPATKLGLLRLEGFEKGSLAKFTLARLDGATMQGAKYHVDHFALDGLKLAQMMRLANDAATPAAAKSSQVGWAMLQTLDGFLLEGLTAPGTVAGESIRIDTIKANWGNFIAAMPMSGQFTMKAQMPLGPTPQEPLATLTKLGLKNPAMSFDGKWHWDEPSQTLEIGPTKSEIGQTASATLSASFSNITRTVLNGGPMMFAIAMPEFKVGPVSIDIRDLGILRLLGADAAASAQMDQGIQALRATIEALPPDQIEQRAILEAVVKFVTSPGSRLLINAKPKGDVPLGALLGAGQATPQLMGFITEQMTTTATVSP